LRIIHNTSTAHHQHISEGFLNRDQMANKKKTKNSLDVDKGLVALFLKMSIEERLRANDNAAHTILELRNAYKQ
jgi:hypothetical protein